MLRNAADNANITFVEQPAEVYLYPVPVVLAVFTLLGNSLIIAAFVKYRKLRDSTTYFIINLGFTDLTTGIVLVAVFLLRVTDILKNNYVACILAFRIMSYLTIVSQLIILVTTFERYMGICRIEKYSNLMTTQMKIGLNLCAWLLPLPLSLAPFFGYHYWIEDGCRFPQLFPKWLMLLRSSIIFFQTAIAMTLYSRILIKAREIHHRICPVTLQGINALTVRNKGINKSIRNGKITAIVTIVFLVTWLPYHTILFFYSLIDIELNFFIISITNLVGLSNSSINPLLYAWQRKDIRNKLKEMLRCKGRFQAGHEGNVLCEFRQQNAIKTDNVRLSSDTMNTHEKSTEKTSIYRHKRSDVLQKIPSKKTNLNLDLEVTEV